MAASSSPTPSQCVESWLTASNLAYAIPNFRMAGIVSPRSFVELELAYFEPLGIKKPEDRKKLFFLIQKVKSELDKADAAATTSSSAAESSEDSYNGYNISPVKMQTSSGRNVRLAGYNPHKQPAAREEEVGMSVDTDNSNMGPVSPVTLGSPLNHEYEVATGNTDKSLKAASYLLSSANNKLTSRERLEKELQKRRAIKHQESNSQSSYTDDFSIPSSKQSKRRSSLLPRLAKTPQTISTNYSRPTIKKGNKSNTNNTISGIGGSYSKDDESLNSETSDLSSSITSYNSNKNSRTYSTYTNENQKLLPSSRMGKRLSAIPSTGVAPLSPLPLSNLDHVKSEKNKVRASLGGRPGTAGSMNSYKSTGGASDLGKNYGKRPSSRASMGSIGSRNGLGSATARKVVPPKSLGHGIGGPKSPAASSKMSASPSNTAARNVSPFRSQGRGLSPARNIKTVSNPSRALSPARNIKTANIEVRGMSPARNIKTANHQNRALSPTRSIKTADSSLRRGISPARRVQTATSRERSLSPLRTAPRSPTSRNNRSPPPNVKSPTSGAVFVHGQPEDKSWGTQIAQLRQSFDLEHAQLMNGQSPYQEDEDYEMRIRVIVRKRPMSKRESFEHGDVDVIHPLDYTDHGRILVYQPKTKLDLAKEVETTSFAFDNVFDEESNNMEIYGRAVRNLIPGVFRGKWASVFAYGQTGSGKTFTMMGCNMTGLKAGNQEENFSEANLGLYFLAARDVFRIAQEPEYENISISVSLFEIYGGKLVDLLNGRSLVKCLEDSKGKVCFPGLTEHPVHDAEELMDIIEQGSLNRSTGTTSANADSSRSHAVLQLSLRKDVGRVKAKEHGRLTFIDLAGSERGADTNQASKTTRMEGAEINTSLLALKEVIRALATGSSMKRIPFRGSKLTQVLKDSFVGKHTRTVMCVNVAPNMRNCDHTLNTLRYADRVKERDPQSGALSAAVAANSRIKRDQNDIARVKVPQRPLTAPATSFRIDRTADSSDDEEVPPPPLNDRIFPDENDYFDEQEEHIANKSGQSADVFDDFKSVDSDDLDSLEEALKSESDTKPRDLPKPINQVNEEKANEEKAAAARSLISTHRSIMQSMLSMVKHEMALVNDNSDGEGDINDYLQQIGMLTNNQLSLISTLKDSLDNFNAA